MKLSEAYTAQARIMLDPDLMPDRFMGPRSPEELLADVIRYAENTIRTLQPGQSLTVARQDDPQMPWTLTWKDAPDDEDGPLGPGDQDDYLNDGDYR